MKTTLLALLVLLSALAPRVGAKTFQLETAGIRDIQDAVDAGALTYEKLVQLYLARIDAYDQKGPSLNSVITLNPEALSEARALDAEFKAKGRRSPLHGIPVLVKDNYDVVGMPNTGGSFLLAGNMPAQDAPMIRALRDAGAIMLAKVNLDEFAAGGHGFSSLGGQTHNPHDLTRVPAGSSGGTGAGLAAWFAPLGLGTDTGGSIRGPCSANGVVGIKPTNGLLSRSGIIPRVLTFDTGGPMGRTVYDVALSLGFMTGIDPNDPLTATSAGLFFKDYTGFLRKDALKGVRIGVIRDLNGSDPEVDRVFDAAVAELKSLGAVVIDPLHYPAVVLEGRTAVMDVVRGADIREQYAIYLATLKGDYPKTLSEMIERADAFTTPRGKMLPHPSLYNRFKVDNAGPPSTSLVYKSARVHGMAMVRDAVLGLIQDHQLDALVYPTFAKRPDRIDPEFRSKPRAPFSGTLTSIANVTQFPDVIVPAGLTTDKLPVTISFLGPAYSEPRLLAYAYAYEQAFPHRVSPATTPALPGETFTY
ncbi:glutamyl-tRNA amidotransferase [Opitutaceae bacterium EW11]|nr:glutamyl-tRNA amidotransferase [Opitutaceae bacterium EW11]